MLSNRTLFQSWTIALTTMVCLSIHAAHAQSEVDDVHIQPRVQLHRPANLGESSTNTQAALVHKNVDLVLVPVTVTDGSDRLITGLDRSNFQVYEGKQQQEIKHFSSEDAPVSIGIILDVSGSMDTKIERARQAVMEFLKISNPQDEFFLITFADAPILMQDFTQSADDVQNRLLLTNAKGRTSLLDAIYLGMGKMKEAKYPRKALLIISDGGDNRSRYSEKEVKSSVKEADVLVYSIGIFDRDFQTPEELLGPQLLTEISEVTGARCYTLDDPKYLPQITQHIGIELRNQYVLGYRPAASPHDGKWRKIKVKLRAPRKLAVGHVGARTGYYATTDY